MTRFEFMKELEELLRNIPADERESALQYYWDYFDDADEENDESIIEKLVSPQRVAQIIKKDLKLDEEESNKDGMYTETGYSNPNYEEKTYEVTRGIPEEQERKAQQENRSGYQKRSYQFSGARMLLIILVCIFAIPIGVPLLIAVLSVAFGVIVTILALGFAFIITSLVLIIAGIAVFVVGITSIVIVPMSGILISGCGMVIFAIGLLMFQASMWVATRVMPELIRGVVNLIRLPFHRRRVQV